jgi:xanthine/uracil/vitamin C permease (AzgA family)
MRNWKLNERSSDIFAELRAGITSFLTMSYSLLVNPHVLSKMGIPMQTVGEMFNKGTFLMINAPFIVIATAVTSGISCLISGFFGYVRRRSHLTL